MPRALRVDRSYAAKPIQKIEHGFVKKRLTIVWIRDYKAIHSWEKAFTRSPKASVRRITVARRNIHRNPASCR